MSTYDDASLVLVPSGYKNGVVFSQKPMDANGQLTFTRASDATRVGPNGYIEKVRENLFTYSTDFSNAAWSVPAVVTHGQPDPFGGNNASLVTFDAVGTSNIDNGLKSITSGVSYTISAWIKGVNVTGFRMLVADNKVINVTSQIVNGSWVRVSLTQTATATGSYQQQVARALNTNEESFYIYGAQVEVSDFGPTDLIVTQATPLSVGPVSGTPRLDYLGSDCPKLLLEPQRTNVCLWSEQIDNAGWAKFNVPTITTNIATAPDGYGGADGIQDTTGGPFKSIRQTFSVSANSTVTASYFVKKETSETNYGGIALVFSGSTTNVVYSIVDAVNGTATLNTVTIGSASTKIEDYGTYYRVTLTATDSGSNTLVVLQVYGTLSTNGTTTGNSAGSVRTVWGFQVEVGASYATSYIPTLGTAVTRLADVCSKTGISSLIGQTEGTLFAEVEITNFKAGRTEDIVLSVYASSSSRIMISFDGIGPKTIYVFIRSSAVSYDVSQTQIFGLGLNKLAFSYGNNYRALYLNGSKIYESTATFPVPSIPNIAVGSRDDLTGQFGDGIKQVLVFPNKLTDAQAIELTSL